MLAAAVSSEHMIKSGLPVFMRRPAAMAALAVLPGPEIRAGKAPPSTYFGRRSRFLSLNTDSASVRIICPR